VSTFTTAVLFVIALWWLGTGLVLVLQQRLNSASRLNKIALACATLVSLSGIYITSTSLSESAQFFGFTSAVVLWGCIELSYYLGFITGLHCRPCPENVTTWKRFRLALGASIWHELLVLSLGFILIVSQHDAINTIGLNTYLVLWLMRWSAKLNLFLGVPNFSTAWFPERLEHVASYIKTGSISPFYFISVLGASTIVVQLLHKANQIDVQHPYLYIMPAVLLILAVVEHLFMVVPFQDLKMWNRVFNSKT